MRGAGGVGANDVRITPGPWWPGVARGGGACLAAKAFTYRMFGKVTSESSLADLILHDPGEFGIHCFFHHYITDNLSG